MKRQFMKGIFLIMLLAVCVIGCSQSDKERQSDYVTFSGNVISIRDHGMTVEVVEGDILSSADMVDVSFPIEIEVDVEEGDYVQIWYDGTVAESYPAQVNGSSYEIMKN